MHAEKKSLRSALFTVVPTALTTPGTREKELDFVRQASIAWRHERAASGPFAPTGQSAGLWVVGALR